jgi:hypothetical protein
VDSGWNISVDAYAADEQTKQNTSFNRRASFDADEQQRLKDIQLMRMAGSEVRHTLSFLLSPL